jgi:prepilin-type processing-associated H-X9-DG protein
VTSRYNFDEWIYRSPNVDIIGTEIPTYLCPSDDAAGRPMYAVANPAVKRARSNYAVCFGPGRWVPEKEDQEPTFTQIRDCQGPRLNLETLGAFRVEGTRTFKDFVGGTSNTTLAAEILSGRVDGIGCTSAEKCDHRGVWAFAHMGFSHYSHLLTPNTSDGDVMDPRYCVHDPLRPCRYSVGLENSHREYAAARSSHAGGVQVLFADSHVETYSDDVDLTMWKTLSLLDKDERLDQVMALP